MKTNYVNTTPSFTEGSRPHYVRNVCTGPQAKELLINKRSLAIHVRIHILPLRTEVKTSWITLQIGIHDIVCSQIRAGVEQTHSEVHRRLGGTTVSATGWDGPMRRPSSGDVVWRSLTQSDLV